MLELNARIKASLTACNIKRPLIARLSDDLHCPFPLRSSTALLVDEYIPEAPLGFAAILYRSVKVPEMLGLINQFHVGDELGYLKSGDVIKINQDLRIRVLYRLGGVNYLLVTENCNSFCLMCSQPPRKVDDSALIGELIEAVRLMPESTPELGITGGEPTLVGEPLFELLRSIRACLPYTSVHMLTNGRNFQDPALAKKVAELKMPDLMLGIPIYSDVAATHDYIVQADCAFDETIRGILNLKQHGIRVEIRVVVHAVNAHKLADIARFIARNMQFVDQVAFMGLEPTGFAKSNLDALWLEPDDYIQYLEEAVALLGRYQVKTLLFNYQLCTLPKWLWPFAVKSISDWKNEYLDECNGCEVKSQCGGFFSSALVKHAVNIQPIHI